LEEQLVAKLALNFKAFYSAYCSSFEANYRVWSTFTYIAEAFIASWGSFAWIVEAYILDPLVCCTASSIVEPASFVVGLASLVKVIASKIEVTVLRHKLGTIWCLWSKHFVALLACSCENVYAALNVFAPVLQPLQGLKCEYQSCAGLVGSQLAALVQFAGSVEEQLEVAVVLG
jgi:hypothetical protein